MLLTQPSLSVVVGESIKVASLGRLLGRLSQSLRFLLFIVAQLIKVDSNLKKSNDYRGCY
jgi:hypothetical protein